jgi:hypothetical protein
MFHTPQTVLAAAGQIADQDTAKRGWLRVGGAALVGARVERTAPSRASPR